MSDLERFARRLVERLETRDPTGRYRPINVGELRRTIMPYRLNRSALGLSSHEDYELLVLRLVAEEGGWVRTNPPPSAESCRKELGSPNPNLDIVEDLNDTTVQFGAAQLSALGTLRSALGTETGAEASRSAAQPPVKRPTPPIAEPPVAEAPKTPPPIVELPIIEPPITPRPVSVPLINDRPTLEPSITEHQAPSAAPRAPSAVCAACSRPLPGHRAITFCPFCGSQVGLVRCGKCGDEIEPGWRHCVGCGAPAASG